MAIHLVVTVVLTLEGDGSATTFLYRAKDLPIAFTPSPVPNSVLASGYYFNTSNAADSCKHNPTYSIIPPGTTVAVAQSSDKIGITITPALAVGQRCTVGVDCLFATE